MKTTRGQYRRGLRLGASEVYIGRPSIFGNPFKLTAGESRDDVLTKYAEYFTRRMREDTTFATAINGLKGKRLFCWCKAHQSCHADVIIHFLDSEDGE